MNDKAVEAGDITVLRKVLTAHWLADMICDHKNQTDKAICSCSLVNLPVMDSVGAAANTWIEHVIQAYLAALPPAPVDDKIMMSALAGIVQSVDNDAHEASGYYSSWATKWYADHARKLITGVTMQKPPPPAPVDEVMVEQLRTDIAAIGGCSDGYCIIDPPSGMHTNGGCSCYRDKMKMQRMGLVVRAFLRAITKDKT